MIPARAITRWTTEAPRPATPDLGMSSGSNVTPMPLTKKATAWLSLLHREAPVPTSIVEKRIIDAGIDPVPQPWLDFQDDYAGYHENIGPDLAVWGLSRGADAEPPCAWIKPNTVTLVSMVDDAPKNEIICADAHPVHDYILTPTGKFRGEGGPCERFEIKIERHGLMLAFSKRGKMRRTVGSDLSKPKHQQLIADMQHGFVPEASDIHAEYYLDGNRLLRVGRRINQLVLYEV